MFIAVLWTVIAFTGFCFALANLADASADLGAVNRFKSNGVRKLLAKSTVIAEVARSAVQLIFIGIGSLVIASELGWTLPMWFGTFFQDSLVLAAALIAGNSIYGYSVRRKLRSYLDVMADREDALVEAAARNANVAAHNQFNAAKNEMDAADNEQNAADNEQDAADNKQNAADNEAQGSA